MLIIGRRVNESIRIGGDIKVTVVDIQAGMVRLGIEAPRESPVWRGEVISVIEKENRKAAGAAALLGSGGLTVPRIPLSAFSRIHKLPMVSLKR